MDICTWRSSQQHRTSFRAPPYMAFLQLSLSLSSKIPAMTPVSSPCLPSTLSETRTKTMTSVSLPPHLIGFRRIRFPVLTRGSRRSLVVGMAPEEEKMTRRSPLDFPIVSASLFIYLSFFFSRLCFSWGGGCGEISYEIPLSCPRLGFVCDRSVAEKFCVRARVTFECGYERN